VRKIAVWIGSIVLAATAAFHGSGYRDVTTAAADSNLEGILRDAVGGLWLYVSIHWLFLAVVAVVTLRLPPRPAGWILGLLVAVLAADIVLLLVHVGPFIGEAMLGSAAVAYLAGAVLSARES
jgi:hypothetical protein